MGVLCAGVGVLFAGVGVLCVGVGVPMLVWECCVLVWECCVLVWECCVRLLVCYMLCPYSVLFQSVCRPAWLSTASTHQEICSRELCIPNEKGKTGL